MTAARTPEEVLSDHLPQVEHCDTCGERRHPAPGAPDSRWYVKHVVGHLRAAGLLVAPEHDREVAAGAWDQGAHWGFFSTTYSEDNPNPYRADRVRLGER